MLEALEPGSAHQALGVNKRAVLEGILHRVEIQKHNTHVLLINSHVDAIERLEGTCSYLHGQPVAPVQAVRDEMPDPGPRLPRSKKHDPLIGEFTSRCPQSRQDGGQGDGGGALDIIVEATLPVTEPL